MAFLEGKERAIVTALARLAAANPFLPERIAHEKEVLGEAFVATRDVWSVDADLGGLNPNLERLERAAADLLGRLRERLIAGVAAETDELQLYEDLAFYLLYARYEVAWKHVLDADLGGRPRTVSAFDDFASDVEHWFALPGLDLPGRRDAGFLFAYGYQTRRAFHFVFRQLHGGSLAMARLRAAVWQSIFTHDRSRYRRALTDRMQDVTTLITGPSGTGKELVARAIGLARFIPFDAEARTFATAPDAGFHPVNLSALSPTLIESELFGHRKGAFTGAVEDRPGWLEACGDGGTVFLDEIGDLDPSIQVKLLRVLQSRTFQRLGETQERVFDGKIIAATNRDLAEEMACGNFREDFYYRLCADRIHTPSLAEQLADHPEGLRDLILVLSRRLYGEEGAAIAAQVEAWIGEHQAGYDWPGNIRELEQCVRNVVVRGRYEPPRRIARATGAGAGSGAEAELAGDVAAGALDNETLLARYTALVYHRTGSYEEASRRLGIDRRTVKARIDRAFLARLEGGDEEPGEGR
jgi:transcriptional regulator with AAA-type ATPase domain